MLYISVLKRISQKIGVYRTIRYSKFYYWVLKYKNPDYIARINADLVFYRQVLSEPCNLIFDIGANHGDKASVFRKIAAAVVCAEPDRESFKTLKRRFRDDNSMQLENIAVGAVVGEADFFVESEGSFLNTLSSKHRGWIAEKLPRSSLTSYSVKMSTLDELIEKYGLPDYLKIDVEGYELEVFAGLSHIIPIISFEANLPLFRAETDSILQACARNSSARFNLRMGNEFIFSDLQDYETISHYLTGDEEISYDVFVYN